MLTRIKDSILVLSSFFLTHFPLSLIFEGFPKKHIAVSEYVSKGYGSYFLASGKKTLHRRLPKTIEPEIDKKFILLKDFVSNDTFVLVINNASVTLSGCFVVDSKGHMIEEINPLMGRPKSAIFNFFPLPKNKYLDASVAVLFNTDNYYHWMFETFPRILLLRKTKFCPDKYVVGVDKSFKVESLASLGIKTDSIIPATNLMRLSASKLIVPSMPISSGNPSPLVCKFLRETFLSAPPKSYAKKYEKVYISRGDVVKRKVSNEKEIFDYLSEKGFAKVSLDGLSIKEQAKIFASAKVIVAAHGAALSNLVFCKKGIKVIEVFHPSYINVCFWALSNCVGLDYYYFMGKKTGLLNLDLGMKIPLEKLKKTIEFAKID